MQVMKLTKLFLAVFVIAAGMRTQAALPNKLAEEEALRPNYIQVFRQRVVTIKANTERTRWESEIARNKVLAMNAANAKLPGTVSSMEVRRAVLELDQKKAVVAAMESRVVEAENLASLVEQSLPMGVKIPIVVEFQP